MLISHFASASGGLLSPRQPWPGRPPREPPLL